MDYTGVISLVDAKTYLGVDDDARDAEIGRMTKSAINYVEKATNHLLYDRDKTYHLEDGCTRIYDFPINDTSEYLTKKHGYFIYDQSGATSIVLNVGYDTFDDIPSDLVEACYQVLKFMFYEQEGSGKMPLSIDILLDQHRRFVI